VQVRVLEHSSWVTHTGQIDSDGDVFVESFVLDAEAADGSVSTRDINSGMIPPALMRQAARAHGRLTMEVSLPLWVPRAAMEAGVQATMDAESVRWEERLGAVIGMLGGQSTPMDRGVIGASIGGPGRAEETPAPLDGMLRQWLLAASHHLPSVSLCVSSPIRPPRPVSLTTSFTDGSMGSHHHHGLSLHPSGPDGDQGAPFSAA